MNPYVLIVDPKDVDENWVLTRNFQRVITGFGSCIELDDGNELDICYDSRQADCIATWIERCLQRDHSSDDVEKLIHKLWYSEIVFPIRLEDIKLFKQMMSVNWRRSEFYDTRDSYYHIHPLNENFYIKVRLALRAGKSLAIRYY